MLNFYKKAVKITIKLNISMKIQTKKLPKSPFELTIEVEPKEYESFLKTSASELSKNIKIEGFRPGKAPYNIIKEKISKQEILNHAINKIVSKTFADAVTEKKLDVLNQPQIEVKKIAPDNNIIYTAKVSLMPQVIVGDINSIKITKEKINIDKKEIDHLLKHLAKSRSKEK